MLFLTIFALKSLHYYIIKHNKIMSKTVEIQIEKSSNLVEGLRKHLSGNGTGVTSAEIANMEQAVKELAAANEEVERLRAELVPKVKHMNEVMATVKTAYSEKKKMLKGCYPQEQWANYGVPDKR